LPPNVENTPAAPLPPLLQGRWDQPGGLADGLGVYDAARQYGALGDAAKPAYTTTVGAPG